MSDIIGRFFDVFSPWGAYVGFLIWLFWHESYKKKKVKKDLASLKEKLDTYNVDFKYLIHEYDNYVWKEASFDEVIIFLVSDVIIMIGRVTGNCYYYKIDVEKETVYFVRNKNSVRRGKVIFPDGSKAKLL